MAEKKKRNVKEVTLYEVIKPDKYELPIFAGTLEETIAFTGRTKNSIMSSISHSKRFWNRTKHKPNTYLVVRAGKVDSKDIF